MNRFRVFALTLSLGLVACGGEDGARSLDFVPAPALAPSSDGGPPARAPADASIENVNGCTGADFAANDRTAPNADRVIHAPDGGPPAQFSPHCMRVRVGQTITWAGDLAAFPISYAIHDSTPNPSTRAVTSVVIGDDDGSADRNTAQVSAPVTISYGCDAYPGLMFGAVDIVP